MLQPTPFKSLKLAFCAVFLLLNLNPTFADPKNFGLRGTLPALSAANVKTIALREDGRYLFYAVNGAEAWNAVDLQDMAYIHDRDFSVDAPIVQLEVINQNTLVVMTERGVQRFDVSEPYAPSELTGKFEFPETNLSQTVESACVNPTSGRVFFLEVNSSSENDHFLRVVDGSNQSARIAWSSLFGVSSNGSTRIPLDMRCTETDVVLFALSTLEDEEEKFFVGRVPAALPDANALFSDVTELANLQDHSWVDYSLSPDGEEVVILYERNDELVSTDGAVAIGVSVESPGLAPRGPRSLGEAGQAIAAYRQNGQVFYTAFIGVDSLRDQDETNQALTLPAAQFFDSEVSFDERGNSRENFGGRFPSRWYFSANDHYVYGLAETTGVHLASASPAIEFVTNPGLLNVNSSDTIEFQIQSDRRVRYEVRFESNFAEDGSREGLRASPGSEIVSDTIEANTPATISIDVADLGLSKNQRYVLRILAQSTEDGEGALSSRSGVAFDFDPPPEGIRNFRLGTGDQSIHVFFDPPEGGDIETYYIFFSPNEDEVSDLDIESAVTFPTGVANQSLTSPAEVPATSFGGRYIIAPLQNGTPLFVGVLAQDSSGQMSVNNPEVLSQIPYATLTLPDALGSAKSCHLKPSLKNDFALYLLLSLGLGLWCVVRRRRWRFKR